MAGGRSRTGRRDGYHAGLNADKVIDAAVELSRGDGLTTWTLRDLGERLGVAPSVIYHHVGGRETLSRHVVERILTLVGQPTTAMPWRQWLREALYPLSPVLSDYPGTASRPLLRRPGRSGPAPAGSGGPGPESRRQATFPSRSRLRRPCARRRAAAPPPLPDATTARGFRGLRGRP